MDPSLITPADVLAFWRETGRERWFTQDDIFDAELRRRFLTLWEAARDGRLTSWHDSDDGMLALILVLDQFPRNLFRGSAMAFATDAQALKLASDAIAAETDQRINPALRAFLYMPFMHSENMADQKRSVVLFEELGDPDNLKYAQVHADIIRSYGRFPHRNTALGRTTTDAETAFLIAGGFSA